jgi:hypothetical protein
MRNPSARPEILTGKPWLLALGKVLRAEYTDIKQPVPQRLAALVKKLEGPSSLSVKRWPASLPRRASFAGWGLVTMTRPANWSGLFFLVGCFCRSVLDAVEIRNVAVVPLPPLGRSSELISSGFCGAAFGRDWHLATDHILIGEGRLRGEAEVAMACRQEWKWAFSKVRASPGWSFQMLGTILIIILILILLGVIPRWPHSAQWGYGPSGAVGVILIIVLILVLLGHI